MRHVSLLVAAGCLVFSTPRLACAQGGDLRAADNARIHLGSLGIKPRIALNRIGIDTNVQNASNEPQHDFTMTFVPGVDTFLPVGNSLLTGKTSYELMYFKKNASQRAANVSQSIRFDIGLARFTPYFLGDYLTTNQRPSPEIDTRVHQVTKRFGAGASARVGGRTSVSAEISRSQLGLGEGSFENVNLAEALGRRSDVMNAAFTHALTPLTTLSMTTSVEHDRFPGSATRNADIVQVLPALEFKPDALIAGKATVGLMRFRPLNPAVPAFTGLVAAVDLSYVVRDWTKFNFKIDRAPSYSVEVNSPYYVMTGFSLDIGQSLGGRFDATGRFGRQYLAYRQIATADPLPAATVARRDRTVTYGLGAGYRLSSDMRMGFNIDYDRRMSPVESRHYDGYRFGGTLSYAY